MLDNCEHLIGASAELVDAILRGAGGSDGPGDEPRAAPHVGRGRVPRSVARDPGSRAAPRSGRGTALRGGQALRRPCSSCGPGLRARPERTPPTSRRICFRLDGLPLALELAAGRLGALSPASIAERLDDRFRLLQAGSRTAPTRQQTLLATLQLEPRPARRRRRRLLFRRLAVFSGGFDLEAAESVCADELLEAPDVANLLATAGREVAGRPSATSTETWRYDLLETVRAYAQERLAEAGEAAALARRHARLGDRAGRARRRVGAPRSRGGEPALGAVDAPCATIPSRPSGCASRSGPSGCAASTSPRHSGASPPRSPPRPSARPCASRR